MRQLLIDKEHPNGIIREVSESPQIINAPQLSYEERVASRIRAIYTADEEFALNRKATAALARSEELPVEFIIYNQTVEQIKSEERGKTND